MKILMVTQYFKPLWEGGGPPRVAYEISRRLVERGHEVVVYTTNFMNTNRHLPTNISVDVEGIEVRYFENFRRLIPQLNAIPPIPFALPMVARNELDEFDIIHIHEHRTALAAAVVPRAIKHEIPYVIQPHGSAPPFYQKQKGKKLFDKIIGNTILHNASFLIALTGSEEEQLIEMGVEPSKIRILPNGINIDDLYCNPIPGAFRKKMGLVDEPIILYLARFHRIKGPDLLIKAFSTVINHFPKAKLVMVGPDDGYLQEVQTLVENEGLINKVLFPGPIYKDQEKMNAFADADVYVLPSRYDLSPISIFEAWSVGTPVIVTDRCGIKDIIRECGMVVPFEKGALSHAIIACISNPEFSKKMGENGQKKVIEHYSWANIVKNIENLYIDATVKKHHDKNLCSIS